MITDEAIKEFKDIYKETYRILLTDKEALNYGTRLINLVKAVYGDNLNLISIDKHNSERDN